MTFDKYSFVLAAVILLVALANWAGLLGDELAYAGFISALLVGFGSSRRQTCRASIPASR